MPQSGPIPTKDADFNGYINIVIPYLADAANQSRLGVSAANKDALVDELGDSTTTDSWIYVYPRAKNPDSSTKTLRDQKTTMKKSIGDRLRDVYADIPDSALTQSDRNTLNLPERDTEPSSRPAISTRPTLKLIVQGGARFIVENRVTSDQTRPSMHPDADYIELAYCIQETPPASVDDCTKTKILSRARETLQLDPAVAGQKIHCYSRWANKTDEAKSSPYTRLHSAVISD